MIAALLKVVDTRPEVDPLTGAIHTDARTSGASPADEAALEWALHLGGAWGVPVVAMTAGPSDTALRAALAAGAASAIRVDLDPALPSATVAAALAAALPSGTRSVVCGAWSADRGSGSVPAFVAAHLGAAQALGLVTLSTEPGPGGPGGLLAERRLDGGRRERLRVPAGVSVLSVEGGSARLRRAPLSGMVAARSARIEVVRGPMATTAPPVVVGPFRPRARVLAGPPPDAGPRERILALTGALTDRTPPQRLVLDPAAAADRILDALRSWGYLPAS